MRICFDVDGVLAKDIPYRPYSEREPYPWVSDTLKKLKSEGHEIIILTARYMILCDGDQEKATQNGLLELIDWLKRYDIPFDEVYLGKPAANIYVDDRACTVRSNNGEMDWELLRHAINQVVNNANL